MAQFTSKYEHQLDSKSRLILPSRFRAAFDTPKGAVLTAGNEGCLALWLPDDWLPVAIELAKQFRKGNRRARNKVRWLFSVTTDQTLDAQGRIPISKDQREFALLSLESTAIVHGNFGQVEIWSQRRWDEQVEPSAAEFRDNVGTADDPDLLSHEPSILDSFPDPDGSDPSDPSDRPTPPSEA